MRTAPQPTQPPTAATETGQQPPRVADPHVDDAQAYIWRIMRESGRLGRPPSVFVDTTGTRDEKTIRLPGGGTVTKVFTDARNSDMEQDGSVEPVRGVEVSRRVGRRMLLEAGIAVDDEAQTRTAKAKMLLGRLSVPLPRALADRIVGKALQETRERHDAPIMQQVAAMNYQRWQADWRSQHGDEPDWIVGIKQKGQRGTQWVHSDQIPEGATELPGGRINLARTEYADLPEPLRRYNEMAAEAAIQVVRRWVDQTAAKIDAYVADPWIKEVPVRVITSDGLSLLASKHYKQFIARQKAARNPAMYVDPQQPERFRDLPDLDDDGHPYEGGKEEYREWIRCAATVLGVKLDEQPELKPNPKPPVSGKKVRLKVPNQR